MRRRNPPSRRLLSLAIISLPVLELVKANPGNCVAGGSGYGVAFDYTQADTISLHWRDIPARQHTMEYWYRNTDLHLNQQQIVSYSAYNVKGYLGQGGLPYEAANELLFMMSSEFISLWRGTGRLDLNVNANPRIQELWSDQWHHYAYTYNANVEPPLVQFFLDGQQLDMGSTEIVSVGQEEPLDFVKAPFSNDWNVAESPDAEAYYGSTTTEILKVSNCPEIPNNLQSTTPVTVWILLAEEETSCSLEQAAQAAEAGGAFAVVFETTAETPLWSEEELADTSNYTALSIPVISVDSSQVNQTIAPLTTLTWTRSKNPLQVPGPFATPIEPAGVLALGQEPDKPWGDFDPMQAANGCLDEFRVWTSVRTPQEIAAHYKLGIDNPEEDLHLYWNFNDPPALGEGDLPVTADLGFTGEHPGLVGNLPTISNEMTFANGLPRIPPTTPLRIPTLACPLVGKGQEVVVPFTNQKGASTILELKSYDPEGDNLQTTLLTVPLVGRLVAYNNNTEQPQQSLQAGDTIVDPERTENKRVMYIADNNLAEELIFTYQVQDGDESTISTGTVRLIPHIVEEPASQNHTIPEDTLSFFSLARPSQIDQANMRVVITHIPDRGTLYQAQFDPDANPTYTSLAKSVGQFAEPMEAITEVGTVVTNDRGIVMYLPKKDDASATPDTVYSEFRYKFVDPQSTLESSTEGTLRITVQAVNDPPISIPGQVTLPAEAESVILVLESTDVDADSAESFATRAYARVTRFPILGQLYQYNASNADNNNAGTYMDSSVTAVPQTFAWAANVVRFSSQFSQCGVQCFAWRDPECPSTDVLSGGWETGSCTATAWHASAILGEPDVYPGYADAKKGWDLSEENAGHEFIELEFPFPVFMNAFELFETYKPGSVWKISTTGEYLDDPNESCLRETCSTKTNWQTLWTKPQETVTLGPEQATIFSPPLCPSTVKSKFVRLDLDTARTPGWNNFDAAKVTGSLAAPPGLVEDPARLVYVPLKGVHGVDQFSFASSDCLGEGEPVAYTITIEPPPATEATNGAMDNAFYQEDVILALKPDQVEPTELDLTLALQTIEHLLPGKHANMTGTIAFTSALGSSDETFTNISLANPVVTMELGVEHRGAPFSYMDFWLEEIHLNMTLTFRVRYWMLLDLACVNGVEDNYEGKCICSSDLWTGEHCSEKVKEVNVGLIVGLTIAVVLIVGLVMYVFYQNYKKRNDAVWAIKKEELKFADPPEVVGRGTFGVVLLAEYRGTQVAVKHVIPPKKRKKNSDWPDEKDPYGPSWNSSTAQSSIGMQSGMASDLGFSSGLGFKSGIATKRTSGGNLRRLKKDFMEEMRYLSKLRHPCIINIMGAVLGSDPMLVMEYMDHGSLYDLLHNETMVIEGEILVPLLEDISQGMRFLHVATPQVLHGDLKAQNILVDTKFRAKVADFGLSQKKNRGGTGTPFWMAPELLRGESTNTAASDVYSFGIILYEVYSRRDPYQDEDPQEVLQLVADSSVQKRPPAPRGMPDIIKSLMNDCVDENPGNRPTFEEVDLRIKRMDAKKIEPGQAAFKASSVSLFDIFPRHVAEALRDGRTVEPEHKESVTIFFCDIVGFTTISSTLEPRKIANMLDRLYSKFDLLSQQHDIFKVETIGDAYMAVTNLVKDQEDDHAKRIAMFAIDALEAANETIIDPDEPEKGNVNIRVGFHSGSVVADVVGTRNPRYCLFGDTVNTASRMESNSIVNRIHCSIEAGKLLHKQAPEIPLKPRGKIPIKGKGEMYTYWVNEGDSRRRSTGQLFISTRMVLEGMSESSREFAMQDLEAPKTPASGGIGKKKSESAPLEQLLEVLESDFDESDEESKKDSDAESVPSDEPSDCGGNTVDTDLSTGNSHELDLEAAPPGAPKQGGHLVIPESFVDFYFL